MGIETLVLVMHDHDAQCLIATWPRIGPSYAAAADELTETGDDAALTAVRQRWAAISGVYVEDIPNLEPILFENDLCGPMGVVDPAVLNWIARKALGLKLPQPTQRAGQRPGPPDMPPLGSQ